MARGGRGSLKDYDAKRDFARTPEPKGSLTGRSSWRFVVQKHAARRLHYDFRLELDGVLKSWAVTKGPSADPAEKRLAVRTEDHPIDYGDFEGTIPKGAYGGGTVMLWDRGHWSPLGDPRDALSQGKLHFTLTGERMKGEWILIRMRPDKSGRENWLLRKVEDDFTGKRDALVETHTTSVESRRTMEAIAEGAAPDEPRKKAPRSKASGRHAKAATKVPAFRKPQLATLVDEAPDGRGWFHEIKYDGYRVLFAKAGDRVVGYTRNGNDWSDRFASLIGAVAALPADSLLIDGEVVALDTDGKPDFGKLQNAFKDRGRTTGDKIRLSCFVFDLLSLDGEDVRKEPLRRRKDRLAQLLKGTPSTGPLHYSEHVEGEGERVLKALCAEGYEGIVSKKADGIYRSGRSRGWLKTKCTRRQEFVIGGWSPSARRNGFASLLLGYYEGETLVYSGRVGTGFDATQREDIAARLKKIERKTPPFKDIPKVAARGARWVKPELVAEIAFTEFTGDGVLRHPAFIGLREDKPPAEIVRETPRTVGTVTRAGVVISNPDRVQFPETGVTKLDLATYYEAVADLMLPHMARRLISLVRCPQGRGKKCFFQRHDSGSFPDSIKRKAVKSSDGEVEDYLYIEDVTGLIACVQMGVLEFHGWGARVDAVRHPDRIVFDLDPDEGLGFESVRAAALDVRERLTQDGLATFVMVTGGKGLHVVAPLDASADWRAVKAYAKGVAQDMSAAEPDRFTATMSKAKRKGRIFIDYLRNERSATAIMPYSTRARAGAPLAVPISWPTLGKIDRADPFMLRDWSRRASAQPWDGYFDVEQALPKRR